MPKAKRRKNIFGFGRKSSGNYIPATGGIAKHAPKHKPTAKASKASDSYDPRYDDVSRSLAKGKKYSQLSSSQQATVRSVASKINPRRKRKRNLEVGLPKNQFINAKVRVKGGKVQVLTDESLLGKAGFSGSAGLKGVSVSGGAKLNPKTKRVKNLFGFGWKGDSITRGKKTYRFKRKKYKDQWIYKWGPDEYGTTAKGGSGGNFRSVSEVKRYIDDHPKARKPLW